MNPNNLTAKYYDIVSAHTKGVEVTNEELELIKSISTPNSKILDIGAGTGRHFIPLLLSGYKVSGVESSIEMRNILNEKLLHNNQKNKANIYDSTWSIDPEDCNNDLIIMMWNSFNEAMIKNINIKLFIQNLPNLLNKNGKLLINSDNPENIEMDKVKFDYELEHENKYYEYSWEVIDYEPSNKITTSEEIIKVFDTNKKLLDQAKTHIQQRWFTEAEYGKIFGEFGYRIERITLKTNDELYLLVSKI